MHTQALGQLTYLRPFVEDFSPMWLATNTMALVAGAMALVYIAGKPGPRDACYLGGHGMLAQGNGAVPMRGCFAGASKGWRVGGLSS